MNIDPVFGGNGSVLTEAGDAVRIDFFKLKYISTATAKELIGNMKLGIQITDIPETKTLIVIGIPYKSTAFAAQVFQQRYSFINK